MGKTGDLTPILFDASVGRTTWPQALDEIAAHFGAAAASIALRGDTRQARICSTGFFDLAGPLAASNCPDDVDQEDPAPCAANRASCKGRSNRPCCLADVCISVVATHVIGVPFRIAGEAWCLSLYRSAHMPAFTQDEERNAGELSGGLSQAIMIARSLAMAHGQGILDFLQSTGRAALLLGAEASVVAHNAALPDFIRRDLGLRIVGGQLVVADRAGTRDLLQGLLQALQGSDSQMSTLSCAMGHNGTADFLIDIVCLHNGTQSWLIPSRLLLIVSDLRVRKPIDVARLRSAFQFTRAEAAFVSSFNLSQDLGEAAKVLGIRKETARTHLRAVFAKTSTNKQGEVISLLSRLEPEPLPIVRSSTVGDGAGAFRSVRFGRREVAHNRPGLPHSDSRHASQTVYR